MADKAQFAGAVRGTREPSLLRAFDNQIHVVGALVLRELHTRFGRENIGYLWIFLEPVLLASAVAGIHFGSKAHYGSNIPTVPFALGGYCLFMMFRSVILRGETTLQSNQPLLYHRMVSIFDMLFARAVLEGAATIASFCLLLLGAFALGLADEPARPLLLLASIGLMLWFSFGLSMLLCAATHASHLVARIIHPITYILLPISGAFYVLEWLPPTFRKWMAWFPMTQIFELEREGQFATFQSPYINASYLLCWCLALTWLGMISLRITRRRLSLR
jgi:capsular polysaccharide transport system permease protein